MLTTGDALPRARAAPGPARRRAARGSSTASAGGGRGRSASRRWSCCCARSARSRRGGGCATSLLLIARTGAGGGAAAGFRAPVHRGALRPAGGHDALAERGRRAGRFGQHAPPRAPRRDAVRRRAGAGARRSSSTCRPIRRSRWCWRRRDRPRRSPSCRAIAPRVLGGAGGGSPLGAPRRLRRRAPPRDADAGRLDARRSADLRRHRSAGDGLGGRRAVAAGGRPGDRRPRRQRRRAVEQPRRRRPGRRARARGGRAGHRGGRRDRELRRRAGARTSASRCGSTAPRSRAGSSTCPPAAARASGSCTPSRAARAQAEVVIDQRRLRARRPPRLPRRGVARPARAAGRRRSAHGAHRGRDVLPGGGAARGRLELLGHDRAARRSGQPRPRRRTAPCSWPTSPARAPTAAAALTRYVESGGGLFISVGDRVDADAWNQTMKTRAAAAARPQAQRRRAARRAPRGRDRRPAARPSGWRRSTGATRCWRRSRRAARGWRRRASSSSCCWRPMPEAPGRRIVLRYENGAPALVDAEVGRGRVLLLTTSVDREWTDLPIRPGFLPLVQEAARYLAARPVGRRDGDLTVGGKREMALGADDRRIEVVKPSGESRWLTPGRARGRGARAARRAVRRDRRAGAVPRARGARRRHRRRAARRGVRGHARRQRIRSRAARRRQAPRSGERARRRRPARRAGGWSCGTRSARRRSCWCCSSRC